ncbi:MAG: universal stress protein [Acidobacteria bacterium]|nr:universal stress protein [Acidobacteriota bacterium]
MRILIATDGSKFSEAAIEECCGLIASPVQTEIKVISAYQFVLPFDVHLPALAYSGDFEELMQKQAEKHVSDGAALIRKRFPGSKLKLTTGVLVGQSITRSSKKQNAGMQT